MAKAEGTTSWLTFRSCSLSLILYVQDAEVQSLREELAAKEHAMESAVAATSHMEQELRSIRADILRQVGTASDEQLSCHVPPASFSSVAFLPTNQFSVYLYLHPRIAGWLGEAREHLSH